jgi:hypothetical protein
MAIAEQVCYHIGAILFDVFYVAVIANTPPGVYKAGLTIGKIASSHSISDLNDEEITENVFKCLDYID